MVMKIVLSVVLVAALVCFAGPLAQTAPLQQRITQPIVMNGQQVQGVTVIQDGAIVSYSCTSPQPYVAVDQSSSGWACFGQEGGGHGGGGGHQGGGHGGGGHGGGGHGGGGGHR